MHAVLEEEGQTIFMTHGHLFGSFREYVDKDNIISFLESNNIEADIVIHGHTHLRMNEEYKGIRFINPGSLSIPKDGKPGSYIVAELKNGAINNIVYKTM